ncbi:mitochondrial carrier domain-containing protein [Phakopsora pachyrhizi]|uniref:Mitochondrial carrier domain-containing protein n=1 Tax=Phakopsora pachyrhizi TaxID=170000 RepID=A0AAV0B751_PHAPC|nr:mitochondrial carrier domain-containing protein [Phakopsora pachyrhizi]CAH7681225.1 mitochondrial carrier domain-containing protein [Phakopsora pachyrhizi]
MGSNQSLRLTPSSSSQSDHRNLTGNRSILLNDLNYNLESSYKNSNGSGSSRNDFLIRSFKNIINVGLMSFSSTAMVMPFEVGKTLLQVQYCPKPNALSDLKEGEWDEEDEQGEDEEEEELDDSLDAGLEREDDQISNYFIENKPKRPSIGNFSSTSSNHKSHPRSSTQFKSKPKSRRRALRKTHIKPDYILPIKITSGVTDMMRAICQWRGEGLLSLWKGQLTTFTIDTLSSSIQPSILSILNILFNQSNLLHNNHLNSLNLTNNSTNSLISSISIQHQAHPTLPLCLSISSYLITGLILSPLDLIRTRLIVQSSQLRHKTYSSPLDCLKKLIRNEGGLRNLYLDQTLLFPAVLDNLLRPIIHLGMPLVIERWFGIDRSNDLMKYSLIEFGLNSLGLLVILPIETIRKRLQLQIRKKKTEKKTSENLLEGGSKVRKELVLEEGETIKSCVELRRRSYNGIVEGFYRILVEEQLGFVGLYRGFKVGLMANSVVFVLGLVGKVGEESSGWTEL